MRKRLALIIFFLVWLAASYSGWRLFASKYDYARLDERKKKLIFYSENAFYYSFYDDLVNGKKFAELSITDAVQYPDKVNALTKYKIAPEVVMASAYSLFRGFGVSAEDFYLYGVFALAGLTTALVFAGSFMMTGSLISSAISLLIFSTSVPYMSRAPAFPALRENFAIPFWLLSIFFIQKAIKSKGSPSKPLLAVYLVSLFFQLLFWQFSIYNLVILLIGAALSYFYVNKHAMKWPLILTAILLLLGIFMGAAGKGNNSHVLNYFLFRLSLIKGDFYSMMYWCDGVFQGLNLGMIESLSKNLLLPAAVLGGILTYKNGIKRFWLFIALSYFLVVLVSNRFLVLAIPVWSILAGQIMEWHNNDTFYKVWRLAVVLALGLSFYTYTFVNVRAYIGEYYPINQAQYELVDWISKNTTKRAVFSGTLNLTPVIRLAAGRRITNNPFYEDKVSRAKNFMAYQVYNRINEKNYHQILKDMGSNYVVVDYSYCNQSLFAGCRVEDVFANEKKDSAAPVLCRSIPKDSKYFKMVFSNSQYTVYDIL